MRIDQVEIEPFSHLTPQQRQHGREQRERGQAHADFGQQRIARVIDAKPMPYLASRGSGHSGIAPEFRRVERKPRTWCNNSGGHGAALGQLAQPGFDEDPMRRSRGAWVQCGKCQNAQAANTRLSYPNHH
jgi:hypothetical protein